METYISELERGLRQPTLAKVDEFADTLGLHPLTILSLDLAPVLPDTAYSQYSATGSD